MPTVGNGNYEVRPGDCMASIAFEHGFFPETLWNLPENAELKRVRKDPYVLLPGDKVFVPGLRMDEHACQTARKHRFETKGVPERLRIVLTDEDDRPLANRMYVLTIGRLKFAGRSDGGGLIQHPIPPTAREGRLVVLEANGSSREYFLALGHLHPLEEISGLQGRLFNLGFYDGEIDGVLNAQTVTAILVFQDKYKLPPSGKNDPATQAKLKELFGC